MRVILLEPVPNQGEAGDIIDVAPGYARNYLFPRELAIAATPGAVKQVRMEQKAQARRDARMAKQAKELSQQIEELTLTFEAKAGPTGRLYGSVTTSDIADALAKEIDEKIDRRKITSDPLREIGEHTVPVQVSSDITAELHVVVYPEGGEPSDVLEAEEEEEAAEAEAPDEAVEEA
jgi:large subunit ribosomal protein L9